VIFVQAQPSAKMQVLRGRTQNQVPRTPPLKRQKAAIPIVPTTSSFKFLREEKLATSDVSALKEVDDMTTVILFTKSRRLESVPHCVPFVSTILVSCDPRLLIQG